MINDTTVFFDLETGGLKPNSPIIQIGAIAVCKLSVVEEFEVKLKFDLAYADPKALEINNYTKEAWADAQPEAKALARFSKMLRRHSCVDKVSKRGKHYKVARLAGHNIARFDCPIIRAAYERLDEFMPADLFRPLDTLHLAWWKFAEEPADNQPERFTLTALCEHYNIGRLGNTPLADTKLHDALADCHASFEIAKCILDVQPPIQGDRPRHKDGCG